MAAGTVDAGRYRAAAPALAPRAEFHGSGPPAVYLGCGRDDRFATASALLAARLPADRVATAEGGHDWPTWTRLWETILRASALRAAVMWAALRLDIVRRQGGRECRVARTGMVAAIVLGARGM